MTGRKTKKAQFEQPKPKNRLPILLVAGVALAALGLIAWNGMAGNGGGKFSVVKDNLRRRKSRMAFLVAGLLIGVATVITLLSLTQALTREAERSHVVSLILMEAVCVSLLAGILGFLSGMGVTRLVLPWLAQGPTHLVWSPTLAAGSILMALIIGAAASFYPALHASRLDPSEALRAI